MPVILYAVGLALAALAVRIYLLGSKKALINWVANSSLFYIMYKRQLAAHHASPEFNVTCFETTILDGAATVLTIPFLQDNFAYILFDHATGECAAVDVADPQAVLDMWRALVARRSSPSLPLNLKYILTTHKHFDHAGGNRKLKAVLPNATIVGGVLDNVLGSTKQAWHGDELNVGSLTIETLAVPCHTMMYRNLYQVLGSLPPSTQVFCGHEYTLNNLSFASYIEPDNVDVQAKACAFSSASRAVLDIVVVSCR
ncbi:hypothetical protein DYB32_003850 [Aphanomyces invadans]|uniref:hydroxyacylglutathione hydrolase n=1 Tax=Aphanomyces invadans TaxID=157072 RepID=A0A418AZF0_9STRA|nr:hypothetical protein DYB32_003850 [Aphanomyces invadans]